MEPVKTRQTKFTVAQAINWCIDDFSADIISLSLGGSQTDSMTREGPSVSVTRKAVDMGIFVVAAVGNDGGDDDGRVSVPSNLPRAISVGASIKGGQVWENSSMGSQTLPSGEQRNDPHLKPEIIAPGESIISTGRGNTWYSSSGTSDATVFVTAALSLILEDQPSLRPNVDSDGSCVDAVKEALRLSTDGGGEVHNNVAGYGELHAGNWLDAVRVYLIANNLAISPIFGTLVVILLFDYDTIKKQCYRSIIFLHWVANYRGVIVSSNLKKKSVSLIALMMLSVMISMISIPPVSVAGINQTTEGLLNGRKLGPEPTRLLTMLRLLQVQHW